MKDFIKQKLEEGFGYGQIVKLLHDNYPYTYEECIGYVSNYLGKTKRNGENK